MVYQMVVALLCDSYLPDYGFIDIIFFVNSIICILLYIKAYANFGCFSSSFSESFWC